MYEKYLEILRRDLPLGESFDILERKFRIRRAKGVYVFYRRIDQWAKCSVCA